MASFRGSSALPDEIIDHIASHLWDDFPTLSAASLVCQTWHGMVRPYVFRSVTILLGNEARMQVLMDMVERTTPMAHWIRELRIAHPKTRIPSFQLWQLWTSDAYGPFMKKLERLHSLVFVDMAVYLMKPPTLEEMLALPTRISEFHGHTIRAVSYVDCRLPKPLALPFVRCLPLLQSMTLVNTKFWPTSVKFDETMYGSVLKSACAVVPHLTTLSVRAQEFAPSIHELFPLESLRTLRTLLFDANQFPDELTVMLQSIGPSLYSFRLNCPYSRYFPDADRIAKIHTWALERLQTLKRLHLAVDSLRDAGAAQILLNTSRLPHLEEITLEAAFEDPPHAWPASAYTAIDEAFVPPAFPSLGTLRFLCRDSLFFASDTDRPHRVSALVRDVLPSLVARGVKLQFLLVRPPRSGSLREEHYYDSNQLVPVPFQ